MPSLFANARSWLSGQMQAGAASGNVVVYRRHAASGAVKATVTLTNLCWTGRTVFASNQDGGAKVVFGDRDYLIPVENLVLDGEAAEPRAGDRIVETIDGVACVFEVLTPDTGDPDHRYSGPDRSVWRVHTKQVA